MQNIVAGDNIIRQHSSRTQWIKHLRCAFMVGIWQTTDTIDDEIQMFYLHIIIVMGGFYKFSSQKYFFLFNETTIFYVFIILGRFFLHFVKLYITHARIAYSCVREIRLGNTRFLMHLKDVNHWGTGRTANDGSRKTEILRTDIVPKTRAFRKSENERGVFTPSDGHRTRDEWLSDRRRMAICV